MTIKTATERTKNYQYTISPYICAINIVNCGSTVTKYEYGGGRILAILVESTPFS